MMKKRLCGAILIITALITMLLPAAEADAKTSASAFTIKSGKLTGYKGIDSTVSVPSGVTVIGKSAFEENDAVKKIILPDSVKKIEAYAFWGCDNLETVVLGNGLTVVDDFAFTNCDGLRTMNLPSNIQSIGIASFADCDALEDIYIPPEVVAIHEDAFDGDYLLNIHCEDGTYAADFAKGFYEKQKNMPVYVKPDSHKPAQENFPADGVYDGVNSTTPSQEEPPTGEMFGSTTVVGNQAVILMQNSDLPVENGSDGNGTGTNASGNLSEPGILSGGVVPERAFYRNKEIKTGEIPEGITVVDRFAYARSSIEQIELPEGLKEIRYAAFYHCDFLEQVSIPSTVTSVEAKAFAHTSWVEHFLAEKSGDVFLISGGVLVAYRGKSSEVVIPEGVRVIAGEAFADHTEIKRVIIPDSVISISEDAFKGCIQMETEYNGDMDIKFVETTVNKKALPPRSVGKVQISGYIKPLVSILLFSMGVFVILRKPKTRKELTSIA